MEKIYHSFIRKECFTIRKCIALVLTAAIISTIMPDIFYNIMGTNVAAEASSTVNSPRTTSDSVMTSKQNSTWDCIYFGSYPKTEIVDKAVVSGVYNRKWTKTGDYVVNASLYEKLENATYDEKSDTVIDGVKYRRVSGFSWTQNPSYSAQYNDYTKPYYYSKPYGENHRSYSYFRYEPIKWRILNVNGSQALLLSDEVLDDKEIDTSTCVWEKTRMRSWLNGYDSSMNSDFINYETQNFIDSAFSENEQKSILTTHVTNKKGIHSNISAGNDTYDKIFLLSEEEIYSTNLAQSYGFSKDPNVKDEAKRCKSTTYAKCMGVYTTLLDNPGCCFWWIRTPGNFSNRVDFIESDGQVSYTGESVRGRSDNLLVICDYGVRPALKIDLSDTSIWKYAGTVSSGCKGHQWGNGKITQYPTALKNGVRTYTCSLCKRTKKISIKKLTATIRLSANKKSMKKGKNFYLTVSKLAKGDYVSSVKSNKSKIVKVKKVGSKKYKITAKKKGQAVITVRLKSGKTAKCLVKVK